MKIKDALNINNAKLICGDINTDLNNFSYDTRTITTGSTFLGIKGETVNGSKFYEEALKKGAKTCILCDIKLDETIISQYPNANIILVDDTLNFIIELAKQFRKSLNIPIIAITGSVGKTSTRNIIADVLSTKYKVLKTSGNLNTNIGLAITILSITDEEIAVLEMGMNHLGEISELSNIAKPNIAVITNVGTAHIGNLGSRENILKAKLEILEGLSGPIIINNDNDLLNAWHKEANIGNKIITVGIDTSSDYTASNLKYHKNGSSFTINNDLIDINVIGKHFIYNSLIAYAIADLYNLDKENVINKLKNIPLEPSRMELINNNDMTIIDDTYNSSYDSVYYSLEVLSSFSNRKIAVLGDILELGSFGPEIHHNIGPLLVKNNIDILITIGDLAKNINESAIKYGFNPHNSLHFDSNIEAINFINNNKQKNDTILVKASHGMNFIEIVINIKE